MEVFNLLNETDKELITEYIAKFGFTHANNNNADNINLEAALEECEAMLLKIMGDKYQARGAPGKTGAAVPFTYRIIMSITERWARSATTPGCTVRWTAA